MQIRSIEEANRALLEYVPLVSQLTGKDTTLERIVPLMARLGNPQDKIPIIHIAGTSGKTSTAYFIASLLRSAGKRVGLTVSPHVDSVTERVQVDGKPLADEKFCAYLGEFLEVVRELTTKPSYFELLCAFSFWVFEREKVDYAVIETGMGGLYDATNVAGRPDKVCVITDIGFDHMHVLGHTMREIAAQKVGIVHENNPLIMYQQSAEVNEVIERWAAQHHAELHITTQAAEHSRYGADFAAGLPDFQKRNWLLAYAAYRFLNARDNLSELSMEQQRSSQSVQVPGRMDIRLVGGKTIVMDGAHNEQKMSAFLASFKVRYPGVKPAVMVALKEGKEPASVAPLVASVADRVIVTKFQTSQDLPARSMSPETLAALLQEAGMRDVRVEPDLDRAYELLIGGPEDVCVITGSFYLLSQLRARESLA